LALDAQGGVAVVAVDAAVDTAAASAAHARLTQTSAISAATAKRGLAVGVEGAAIVDATVADLALALALADIAPTPTRLVVR
jgi:hypothetical protein